MRLVFMGTPAFALPTLKALHTSEHEVVAVYTQPPRPAGRGQNETPSPVHAYALEHGLPVFTPTSLKTEEAQKEFVAHQADAAIVAAYGLLLPKAILEAYPRGCINIHPSLLPRWRGAAPIQRAVMAGDEQTAIVIMQMDEGLDTGDMLAAERILIPKGMTAGELHDLLAEKSPQILLDTLDNVENGTVSRMKQPDTGVTYAKKITKEECLIDWNKPARDIYFQILGLSPAPGAFFVYNGEAIKILNAEIVPYVTKDAAPGTILDERLLMRCGENGLRPTVIKRPGKKAMSLDELLRGNFSIPPGTVL